MITLAVLTLSDRGARGERKDLSGHAIKEMLGRIGAVVVHYEVLPDEKEMIKAKLVEFSRDVDVILTTGGTGLSPRDVTPDATMEIIDREVPGIAEAMRADGMKKTSRAMLSRAVSGVKGRTLIVNLPGSPKAVEESLGVVLDIIIHAVEKIKGEPSECGRT